MQIANISIVDIAADRTTANQDVIIRDGLIDWVGPGSGQPADGEITVIEGAGRFLIPGLWDFHVHVFTVPGEEDFALPIALENGVTGIRDVGALLPAQKLRAVAAAVAGGERIGPRMVLAGAVIDGPPGAWPGIKVAATPAQGRRLVREFRADGWHYIKTYSLLRPEVYQAIAREARRQGMRLYGHVPEAVTLAEAVVAGHGVIEHFGRVTMACSRNEAEIVARRRVCSAQRLAAATGIGAASTRSAQDAAAPGRRRLPAAQRAYRVRSGRGRRGSGVAAVRVTPLTATPVS